MSLFRRKRRHGNKNKEGFKDAGGVMERVKVLVIFVNAGKEGDRG